MTGGGVRYKATSLGLKGAGRLTAGICVRYETDQTEADEVEAEVGMVSRCLRLLPLGSTGTASEQTLPVSALTTQWSSLSLTEDEP